MENVFLWIGRIAALYGYFIFFVNSQGGWIRGYITAVSIPQLQQRLMPISIGAGSEIILPVIVNIGLLAYVWVTFFILNGREFPSLIYSPPMRMAAGKIKKRMVGFVKVTGVAITITTFFLTPDMDKMTVLRNTVILSIVTFVGFVMLYKISRIMIAKKNIRELGVNPRNLISIFIIVGLNWNRGLPTIAETAKFIWTPSIEIGILFDPPPNRLFIPLPH